MGARGAGSIRFFYAGMALKSLSMVACVLFSTLVCV